MGRDEVGIRRVNLVQEDWPEGLSHQAPPTGIGAGKMRKPARVAERLLHRTNYVYRV